MVSIIKNLKKSHPRATKEIIQEKIHKSKIYISWIREDDKAKDVSDCWDKYKDQYEQLCLEEDLVYSDSIIFGLGDAERHQEFNRGIEGNFRVCISQYLSDC